MHDRMLKPDRKRSSWVHGKKELDDLGAFKGLYEDFIHMDELMDLIEEAFRDEGDTIEEGAKADACRRMGFVSMSQAQQRILKALNNFSKASEGKLFDEPKGKD